jgi:outer membrane lipoprotein SlyB
MVRGLADSKLCAVIGKASVASQASVAATQGGALSDMAVSRAISRWARLQLELRLDDGPKQPDAYLAVIAHE